MPEPRLAPIHPITTRYCLQCGSVIEPESLTGRTLCLECLIAFLCQVELDRSDQEPDWSAA